MKRNRLRKILAVSASTVLAITNPLWSLALLGSSGLAKEAYANGNGLVVTKSVNKIDVWRDVPEDRLVEYEIEVENTDACADAPIDAMLVMDRSGSMAYQSHCVGNGSTNEYWCKFFGGTWVIQPLQDLKTAAKGFVDLLDDSLDYTGLVSYSSSATLDQGLTSDHDAVKAAIDTLSANGTTNIGDGIAFAHSEILTNGRQGDPDYAVPVIILLTDGKANVGSPNGEAYAKGKADLAKADGIRIIAIGLEGDGLNEAWLQNEIASSPTDYYYAPTSGDLSTIYASIKATLGDSINTVLSDDISDILIDADLWSYDGEGTFGSYDAGTKTLSWDLGTLYCNADRQLKTLSSNSAEVHFSVVVHDDAPDGDVMDNKASATNFGGSYAESNVVHTTIHTLEKVDNIDPVTPGEMFTYTIDVATGDYPVSNLQVVDYLDPNVSYGGSSNAGVYDSVEHKVTWNFGATPAHFVGHVTLDVKVEDVWVDTDDQIYNRASIQNQYDGPIQLPYETNFPPEGLIWVDEYTKVGTFISLTVDKTDVPDPVEAGGLLSYDIVYENTGNTVAKDVVIMETYDPNVTFVSASITPDSGTDNVWTIGDLLPGSSHTITVVVKVASPLDDGTILDNKVDLKYDVSEEDGETHINAEEETEVNSAPVLTISKADNPDPVIAGQTVGYTLKYENVGNMASSNTEIVDTLPTGFSYVAGSSKIDGAAVADPTGTNPYTWSVGTLDVDGSHTLTFDVLSSVTLANGVVKTDTAVVQGNYLDQGDMTVNVSSNDSENTTVVAPVLTITKTNNAPAAGANPSATVTFTVVVTNTGGATANGVVITDTLPAGVTLVSGTSTLNGTAVANPTGTNPYTWPVGTLAVGASATLKYNVTVNATATAGAYSNSSFADANDIDPTDIVTSTFSVVIPSVLGEQTGPGQVLGASGGIAIVGLILGSAMVCGSRMIVKKKR